MPFVSDIAGPQHPVPGWPPLAPGTLRRTSTIDTRPDGTGAAFAELRARDVRTTASGDVDVVEDVVVLAHLTDRVIDDITGDDDRLSQLRGVRVGPGFRATASALLGPDVARATLLHLLLDDWVGANLVSGYGIQHAAITNGVEEKMADVVADHLAGICSGFAPDAAVVDFTRRNLLMPCVNGPIAPPLPDGDAVHPTEPLAHMGCGACAGWTCGPTVARRPRSTRTSGTPTSTVRASRRSSTSTPSLGRSTPLRAPSRGSRRRPACCRGRSAPAHWPAPSASRAWR